MSAADGLAAGRLLVATPILVDPNFDHTVVLLLDLDENGALGVVLNRPSEVPVRSVLPDWRSSNMASKCSSVGTPPGSSLTTARSAPWRSIWLRKTAPVCGA